MLTSFQRTARLAVIFLLMAGAGALTSRVARADWGYPLQQPGGTPLADAAHARQRLASRPLDGAAFRILGERAAAAGDNDTALAFFAISVRRDPRDPLVRLALIEVQRASGDGAAVAEHLDALLRVSPASGEPALRRLLDRMDDDGFRQALVQRLAGDPPWRPLLPAALAASSNVAASEQLLAELGARSRLRAPEVALRADLLERLDRPRAARKVWSEALPDGVRALDGPVFDGGFESGEGPQPYGWDWGSVSSAVVGVDTAHHAEGRSALTLEFAGRIVDVFVVSQALVLGPGAYRLDVQVEASLDNAERGLSWRIACRDGNAQLAQLPIPARTEGWERFSVVFEVPGECARQRLELRHEGRNPGERRPSGRISFDGLRLRELQR